MESKEVAKFYGAHLTSESGEPFYAVRVDHGSLANELERKTLYLDFSSVLSRPIVLVEELPNGEFRLSGRPDRGKAFEAAAAQGLIVWQWIPVIRPDTDFLED